MSFTRYHLNPTDAWGDADVFGDIYTSQMQVQFNQRFDVLCGNSSKQPAGTWRLWTPSLFELTRYHLCRHEAQFQKDGKAFVFAKARCSGSTSPYEKNPHSLLLAGRRQTDIEALSFAGFDIDSGGSVDQTIERLKALGKFAILYTTHSHMREVTSVKVGPIEDGVWSEEVALEKVVEAGKFLNPVVIKISGLNIRKVGRATVKHDPVEKFRLLFPLEKPFFLSPNDQYEHSQRCAEWREKLVQFAQNELHLTIDESGCDVNRLFYTPRHKPGDQNWYSALVAGPFLNIEQSHFGAGSRASLKRTFNASDETRDNTFRGPRPILSDGFDLIDWNRDWGRFFQMRELLHYLQWDFASDNAGRSEARILCPNDHAHTVPDDRSACWVKDGAGHDKFVVYCHHNACTDMGTLDQLVELENSICLPDEFETLSELLCDAPLYKLDDGSAPPDRQRYLRWDADEEDVTAFELESEEKIQ